MMRFCRFALAAAVAALGFASAGEALPLAARLASSSPFLVAHRGCTSLAPVLEEVRRRGLQSVAVLSCIQFDHICEARRLDKEIFVHHIFSEPRLLDELAAMGNNDNVCKEKDRESWTSTGVIF